MVGSEFMPIPPFRERYHSTILIPNRKNLNTRFTHCLTDSYIIHKSQRWDSSDAEYIEEIVAKLVILDPYRIILFGSQASGTYTEDSDIDLFVILDSERVSQTYEEKMHNYLTASNQITEINKRVPIDLIVYTKAEYDILEENNVSFINEIRKTGKTLYEKTGKRLA